MTIRKRLAAGAAALAASAVLAAAAGSAQSPQHATAIFAGGCFWCMEPPFDALDGVLSTTSGYTGGQTKNPTYEQVSEGRTGHSEAIRVVYDLGFPRPKPPSRWILSAETEGLWSG
jgi:peptide-methionine (S)-S-oxide reductase